MPVRCPERGGVLTATPSGLGFPAPSTWVGGPQCSPPPSAPLGQWASPWGKHLPAPAQVRNSPGDFGSNHSNCLPSRIIGTLSESSLPALLPKGPKGHGGLNIHVCFPHLGAESLLVETVPQLRDRDSLSPAPPTASPPPPRGATGQGTRVLMARSPSWVPLVAASLSEGKPPLPGRALTRGKASSWRGQ